jgi:hypothetical protein
MIAVHTRAHKRTGLTGNGGCSRTRHGRGSAPNLRADQATNLLPIFQTGDAAPPVLPHPGAAAPAPVSMGSAAPRFRPLCCLRGTRHPFDGTRAGDTPAPRFDGDHLVHDGAAAEGVTVLAGLRSGDGPLSVRARPFSLKHDCDRRTTSTGGKCLVNVHAKSYLIPESLRALRSKTKGQAGACPDRARAIPCTVRAVTGQFP